MIKIRKITTLGNKQGHGCYEVVLERANDEGTFQVEAFAKLGTIAVDCPEELRQFAEYSEAPLIRAIGDLHEAHTATDQLSPELAPAGHSTLTIPVHNKGERDINIELNPGRQRERLKPGGMGEVHIMIPHEQVLQLVLVQAADTLKIESPFTKVFELF